VQNDADKRRKSSFFNYRKGIVIRNGVNLRKFDYQEIAASNNITVGAIAKFRREKRLDRWVEIAKRITELAPGQFRFILAGHGEKMPEIVSMVNDLQLKDEVDLPGAVYNTADYYHTFDFFLMTSDWEGLPVALLEAMACGCIPVVTNVGGIKQLQIDQFGFKYERIDEAARYIIEISYDKELVALKKRQARIYVETNFSLERQLNNFLSLYNSLTTNPKFTH
jgi:glycosyltransferase involved in cell wall biosynthesis